jgi:hypothetical protein
MWFNVEHYHNTHSTQYRCTHYTLLSTDRCFQSVCSSVTPWCVILFSTNSSPLVHPPVHFSPEPHQSRHPQQGLSLEMRTVHTAWPWELPSTVPIFLSRSWNSLHQNMETVCFSETLVLNYETIRRQNPKHHHTTHRRENLKSHFQSSFNGVSPSSASGLEVGSV